MYKDEELYDLFKIPIKYVAHTKIYENLNGDLELIGGDDGVGDRVKGAEDGVKGAEDSVGDRVKDPAENNTKQNNIYQNFCSPTTKPGNTLLKDISQYYTSDTSFLKDTQLLLKSTGQFDIDHHSINQICDIWHFIKNDKTFLHKNHFIEWDKLSSLNTSVTFLSFVSFFHLFSPVINLLSPLFLLIIPFLILKMVGTPINFNSYKTIFIQQLRRHSIGRLFFEFTTVNMSQKIYLLFMAWVYIYNIYTNILNCKKFYNNILIITKNLNSIVAYNELTLKNMELLLSKTNTLNSYSQFRQNLNKYYNHLQNFNQTLKLLPLKNSIRSQIINIGDILKQLYILHTDYNIEDTFQYSIAFNGYIDVMQNISTQINSKKLSFCKFSQKYTKIKKLFHPNILDADAVKNDATLNKNIIITGPNAAGKTTILKSIIINLLLSQQFGIGFYGSKTIIKPYDFIHCYINIPDTSQRDSLFQAEARRCKNILDIITKNPDKTHFCIFDELFSGTNPYEAISCGTSYLHYLSKLKNVTFLLTTHFDKLCKLLNKNSNIVNKHMKSSIIHNNPVYHYKMVDGISSVRGAITVLRDLSFGESIISKAEKILTQL